MLNLRSRRQAGRGCQRQHGDGCRAQARHLRAAFLLAQEADHRRQLPDVPGAGGESAQALACLRHPAAEGMKVWTHSDPAVIAQKGVMEFLLINHPLDCPICDQGGECQLQDLAVGYGASSSRYTEAKRVVFNKNLGPLIATDMTRCIHCTRCVRFGQEIAGIMELGLAHRGEHVEILTFVGNTVDSELSGNMIDLCPVGALTSKPFRYTARTWELARRRSIAPHDGLGSNLVVQVMNDRVMRVVPQENEAINDCWLSDRDRFSYEGLNAESRLSTPMVKRNGSWRETDWQTALEFAASGLQRVREQHGGSAIGTLASPHSTLEELHLAQKLTRTLGSDNIDFRLRQSDFTADPASTAEKGPIPWLGMSISDFAALDRVLVVGSFLRRIIRCSRSGCVSRPSMERRSRSCTPRPTSCSLRWRTLPRSRLRVFRERWPRSSLPPRLPRARRYPLRSVESKPPIRRRQWPRAWQVELAKAFSSATSRSSTRKRHSCTRWRRRSPSLPARVSVS